MSSQAEANLPALSAAKVKPNTPANKLTSASASAATPVVAYNDPFVVVSRFAVLVRLFAVLPAKYDTDERLEFVVNSKLFVRLSSVTVLPSEVDTEERLLFVVDNRLLTLFRVVLISARDAFMIQ